MRVFVFGMAIAATIIGNPAPAMAQMPPALLKCISVARDAERLACYDKAIAASSPEARASSETRTRETTRIAEAEAATAAAAAAAAAKTKDAAKREAFGAEAIASRPERFATGSDGIEAVEAGITEVLTNRSGLGVFLLDNGQLWRQANTDSLPPIRPGDRVRVERSTLGGYKMEFLKQKRWALVKRMR